MATITPASVEGAPRLYYGAVTIPAGTTSPTDYFDLWPPFGDHAPLRLYCIRAPVWTAGNIYFYTSLDGTNFYRVDTPTGLAISVSVNEQSVHWPATPESVFPGKYLRLQSQNTQAADAVVHCWFAPYFAAKGMSQWPQ